MATRSLCMLTLTLVFVTGCFSDSPASPPEEDASADASADLVAPKDLLVTDAPADAVPVDGTPPPTDVPASDGDGADASPTDAAPRCATDRDCTDATLPRCQSSAGRCVRCLASEDCPRGAHCDTARNTCEAGCAADTDCRRGAEDAGVGPIARCDTTRGQCIECTGDDECPVRTICTEGLCAPGCNERRGCSVGESCCRNLCADPTRDTSNCGACGTRCEAPNGVPVCAMGRCAIESCNAGFADCNGDVADGCEADTRSDARSCGRCGTTCPDVDNATVACAAGRCGFSCRAGYADCDGSGANGCERNLDADTNACGSCTNTCPAPTGAAFALCGMGVCGFSCATGRGNCDRDPTNGCETATQTSAMHCGACDSACPARPHASPQCAAGTCVLRCDDGFGDCDGNPANGCEADLASTTGHCGRCGNACTVSGGTAACVRSACTIAACGGDFFDCDGVSANGCETDLRVNAAHCGMCNVACPSRLNATGVCEARSCTSRCISGFADCDGNAANGCEVDTRTSVSSCGSCGRACAVANGTAGCSAGACTLATCNAGFGDCDRLVANGCEADLTRSAANCGGCGVRGVEVCDGRDNSCDGRIDEGCPTGLTGFDGYDFTSPTYGSGSGVAYDLACPAGTFAASVNGRLYSSYYQNQWSFRCVRPRLVEDTSRTPYAYSIAWDPAGTAGPVGGTSGTTYVFDCPAGSVVHRASPYVYSTYISQMTWECASWSVTGSPAAGWRIARTVTRSTAYGIARGTRYDYTCPDEAGNASALRSIFGRFYSSYAFSGMALRCSAPAVTVR